MDSSDPLGCVCIFLSEIIEIIEMTNEASAEAMLVWIMPCKEEFGDSQMSEWRAELAPALSS